MKISACVITKNEEYNIAKCLNSMKSVVNEMIVVDTGSSDNTVGIAKSCGAKIFDFVWKNDFAATKNFAIEKAKGDWIIFLDADEFFAEESILSIKETLMQLDKQSVDAIMCQLINIDVDCNNRLKDSFTAIRIFRKDLEIRYKNAIHEELVHKNKKLRLAMLTDQIKIYHTGYSSSIVEQKLQRNLAIILAEIEKNGEEEKFYRYLCDCYHGLRDYDKAVKYAKLHIATSKASIYSESIVYLKMLYALTQTSASVQIIKKEFENAIEIFADIPDFYAQYANYLFDQKQYAMAIKYYQQSISVYKSHANTGIATAFKGKLGAIYCNLGRLYLLKNEPESAMNSFCEALMLDKFNEYAFQNFYQIIAKYPEVQIIELLNSIYQRTKEELSFLAHNLNVNIFNKVYVYYTNLLKNEFGIEDDNTLPYQLLSLKEYTALYQYSLKSLGEFVENLDNEVINISESQEKTSIIILTYNQLDYTKLCIESIRQYTEPGTYEIIVVDNHSKDDTVCWLKRQADIKCILNDQNNGFPKACNQGIEIASGTEILLLNNDTIVTPKWLVNLKIALYSEEKVGAVGAITNRCTNYQAIRVDYADTNELQAFAQANNISNRDKWEEKNKLVGFCMLIKRAIIKEIGYLDERFTPGNFEDDDYSYRIISAGYKLFLCHDVFIHHYGSVSFDAKSQEYQDLIKLNQGIFKEKWGFDTLYSTYCRDDLLNLMDIHKPNIKVLEVGCACGTTLLKIKYLNKTAQVYGIELCPGSAGIAKHFANITAENIENTHMAYEEEFFDYIIFGDVLEHLYDPLTVLQKMKRYVKSDGYILASIPNIMHYSIIKDLLAGNWTYKDAGILDKTHIRFFTFKEIDKMFDAAGLTDLTYGANYLVDNNDENVQQLLEKLKTLNLVEDENQLKVYQYIVKAGKNIEKEKGLRKENNNDESKMQRLKFLLRRIENDLDLKENINDLMSAIKQEEYNIEQILASIEINIFKKSKVIAHLMAAVYEKGNEADTLNFAEAAYQKYSNDVTVLYIVASILYLLKEKEKALQILKKFPDKDEKIKQLIEKISGGK